MELRPYQREAVEAIYRHLRERDDHPCAVLPTACHAEGHPILMFDGAVKPIEDVRIGDLVMGPDSRPRCVLSLCRGDDDMYRVIPHRGEPFIVNGGHILSLVSTNEGKDPPCHRRGGEIDNISVRDYLLKSKSWRHLRKLYHTAVEFSQPRDLPIPPYILGLLLGDGGLTDGCVDLTTADDAIAEAWDGYARSIGCETSINASGGRCPTYTLVRTSGQHNVVTAALGALGLAGLDSSKKFIPHAYLTANRPDRLRLLAGLMDSDGSANKSGADYITKSRELASDIMFLTRSLGFASHCTRKYCTCQTGVGGWFYRLSLWGDFADVPCRLSRRKPAARKQNKSVLRTGFTIEVVGRGPYYGFLLDGDHLYLDGHFMVHHNSGKTPIMATICHDAVQRWNGRVLILAHVRELLEQAAEKLRAIAPDVPVGLYSAGLNRRDLGYAVTIAGIQSVYQKAGELGPVDLVIVDEAHLIPPDGEGMYRQFLTDLRAISPHLRVIGLTATPFRMKSGPICAPENILNHICFEIGVRELIVQGYLCPLRTKAGGQRPDYDQLHVRAGEYVANEVEALMDTDNLVLSACREIVEYAKDRHSVLIFASGIRHAEHVVRALEQKHHVECGFVSGETLPFRRDEYLHRFRAGDLKYLCNVNVLTTGFDAPNIDCVALLRPTLSPGLFYQMVGRGFRLHPGKSDCLVLDFGGNVLRHGPVDQLRIGSAAEGNGEAPAKECPQCHALIATGYAVCPDCGYAFPPPQHEPHDARASGAAILSGEVTVSTFEVSDTFYAVHSKRGADPAAPRTMRVDYVIGWQQYRSEWVCFEHAGYARQKAEGWWKQRCRLPVPDTAEDAVYLARAGALAPTRQITVRSVAGEPYDRIVDYQLGEIPGYREAGWDEDEPAETPARATIGGIPEEDIPF